MKPFATLFAAVLASTPSLAASACPMPQPVVPSTACFTLKCNSAASEWMEVYKAKGTSCKDTSGCSGTCDGEDQCVAADIAPSGTPTVSLTSDPSTNGYTISWTQVSCANSYSLRENSSIVYSGSRLSSPFLADSKTAGVYSYNVAACKGAACGVSGNTVNVPIPSAPATLSVPSQVITGPYTLSWAASSYAIQYVLLENGVQVYSGSSTSVGRTPTADKSYVYKVRACAGPCGPWTSEASVTVLRLPPAPSSIGASTTLSSNGRYSIAWTKPDGYIIDGYYLDRKIGSGAWSRITLGADLGYAETQAVNGVYSYRVSAYNASGSGPPTGQIDVTVSIPLTDQSPDAPISNPNVPPQEWVGALRGKASADGGAAIYSIPIDVPPGRRGMQPEVALSYSSRDGNGIAGVGWSLTLPGAIYRCPAMIALGGKNVPVRHDSFDKLCFEGKQFIARNNPYGSSGAEYRTELETYDRIYQRGADIQSWSSYFRVEHKSGRVGIYLALKSDNSNAVPDAWRLLREFDPNGNCLDYRWVRFGSRAGGGEEWVLSDVAYTGRRSSGGSSSPVGDSETCTMTDPYRTVHMEYEARADMRTTYSTGAATLASARLHAITTWVGGTAAKRYELAYHGSPATGRSLLASVKECAGGACSSVQLPPTMFTYQGDAAAFSWERPNDTSGNAYGTDYQVHSAADFDGDGARDLEILHKLASGAWDRQIRLTSCNRQIDISLLGTIGNLGESVDLDNDGRAELVAISGGNMIVGRLSCEQGLTVTQTVAPADSVLTPNDFDGDGRIDLLHLTRTGDGKLHSFVCLNRGSSPPSWDCSTGIQLPEAGGYEAEKMRRDLNGDGLLDLLFDSTNLNDPSARIVFYQGGGSWASYSLQSLGGPKSTNTGAANKYYWLDINGDGLLDIYRPGAYPSGGGPPGPGTVWLNRGGTPRPGMFQAAPAATIDVPSKLLFSLMTMDVDGDGQDEILAPSYRTIAWCGGPNYVTCPGSGQPTCGEGKECPEVSSGSSGAWCGNDFDGLQADISWDRSIFAWKALKFREQSDGSYSLSLIDTTGLQAPLNDPFLQTDDFFGDGMQDMGFRYRDSYGTCSGGGDIVLGKYQDSSPRGPRIVRNRARAPDLLTRVDTGVVTATPLVSQGPSATWSYYPLSSDSPWSVVSTLRQDSAAGGNRAS